MNLYYLTDHSFSLRDYERFGIEFFLNNNVNIKILNLYQVNKNTNLKKNDFKKNETKIQNVLTNIKTNKQLKSIVNKFRDSYIIDLRVNNFNSNFPITWFQNYGANIIKLETNILPGIYATKKDKIYNFIFKSNLNKRFKTFFNQFKKKDKSIIYDFLIKTGEHKNLYIAKNVIRSHSFDYDYFLKFKNLDFTNKQNNKNSDNKIIFIEAGMCSHPDYELHKTDGYCTPQKYYPSMNLFFDKIEKFFNNKITICLNPKEVNDHLMSANYKMRKVIKNDTFQAIKNSNLVISHDSTAISFAILFKKPLLLVTTDEIEKNNYIGMKYLTKYLKVNSINVDKLNKDINFDYESKKIIKNYDNYIDNFIKTKNSPEEYSWKIFLDFIKRYKKI